MPGSLSTPGGQAGSGTSLPSQTGNSGKFLTTDGTNASWTSAGGALRYSQDIGDGSTTTITVTHNLGTQAVVVACRDKSTNDLVAPTIKAPTVNTVSLTFAVAPTASQYAVTVVA